MGGRAGLDRVVERRAYATGLADRLAQLGRQPIATLVAAGALVDEVGDPELGRGVRPVKARDQLLDQGVEGRRLELDRRHQVGRRRGRQRRLGIELDVVLGRQERAPDQEVVVPEHADRRQLRVVGAQQLGVELARDRLGPPARRVGLAGRLEFARHDHDARALAQQLAQLRRRVGQAFGAGDPRGLDRLAAGQQLGVGPQPDPQLGEAIVTHEARVVDGLVQAVEADHAADLVVGEQVVLVGLDPDPVGQQREAGHADRDQAHSPVEIALVEAVDLGVTEQVGHALASPAEQRVPIEHQGHRRAEAAGLDRRVLEAAVVVAVTPGLGPDLPAVEARGAHVGPRQHALGATDIDLLGACAHDHPGGPAGRAVAGLDHDLLGLEQQQGVDPEREGADMREVDPLLRGEQEVEQLGQLVLAHDPAGPRDQHVAVATRDVDVVGPARDRGLDQLEHIEVRVGQREPAQLLDGALAGQLELLALGEADVALAGPGDDLIDARHLSSTRPSLPRSGRCRSPARGRRPTAAPWPGRSRPARAVRRPSAAARESAGARC